MRGLLGWLVGPPRSGRPLVGGQFSLATCLTELESGEPLRLSAKAMKSMSKPVTQQPMINMARYLIAQLDQIDPVPCPCGEARRAFASPENGVATVHRVTIREDAQTHYHKRMTEIYLVLEGEGHIELDGQLISVRPMTSILIKPGCRHRAVGKLTIINVAIPAFDPTDEWFD